MRRTWTCSAAYPTGHQLYGHTALTQLKAAAALGALHGEVGSAEQWWELAGLIIDMSTEMMNAIAVASGAVEVASERQAGERLGDRYAAADQRRDDAKVRDVAARLYAKVGTKWTTVNSKAIIAAKKQPTHPRCLAAADRRGKG